MAAHPKYSRLEIERRWLVDLSRCPPLDPTSRRVIEDVYVDASRLRLRKITRGDGASEFKLCKKYGAENAISEPIVNIYLTETEYISLRRQLAGALIRKSRYTMGSGAIDIYFEDAAPLAIFSVEFEDRQPAQVYQPPAFVLEEVSGNPEYSGASLARPPRSSGA